MGSNSQEQNTDQLVQKLFAEITKLAREKDFPKAELVREKLMAVAPTALSEIIGSADIIEKEKTSGLDTDHLAVWDNMYQDLSEEETNCLFYSLKKIVVPPKRRILEHGGYNTRLYFIDKGTVTVYSQQDGKNKAIAQLGRGDLLGEYTFTTIAVCSASAVTNTEVHLRCLESSATDDWDQKQPGLYEKLTRYCLLRGQVGEIEQRQKQEELNKTQYSVDGVVTAHVLTKEGKKSNSYFRGALSTISKEATSFEMRTSKKETARALLARNLYLEISLPRVGAGPSLTATGKVERVTFHLHNDYTVYLSFHKPLGPDELKMCIDQSG